jgi:hypothetical protein
VKKIAISKALVKSDSDVAVEVKKVKRKRKIKRRKKKLIKKKKETVRLSPDNSRCIVDCDNILKYVNRYIKYYIINFKMSYLY